jgi:mannose-6-phosphate isomerase-like protein (cupin superfamily)
MRRLMVENIFQADASQSRETPSAAESLARQAHILLKSLAISAQFLEDWPDLRASRIIQPHRLPVCSSLSKLDAAPATAGLVKALVERADAIAWRQTYTAADFGPAFLDNYGWTELMGLRGPIASAHVACGFLILGPRTEYPSHAHEAEELYLPLAGTALWMRGEESFVARSPGAPIIHPSWTPHAMRTQDDPLLALYVWRGGDLAAKSKIMPNG